MTALVHKRKPGAAQIGRRTVCGQYGNVARMWSKVTCSACLKERT